MQLDKFLAPGEIVLRTHQNKEPSAATLVAYDEHGITVKRKDIRGVTYIPWTSVEYITFEPRPHKDPRQGTVL